MKKKIFTVLAAVAVAAAAVPFMPAMLNDAQSTGMVYAEGEYVVPEYEFEAQEVPDLECFRFTAGMGTGLNLGNTFDATSATAKPGEANLNLESAWVGVKTTEANIDAIKAAGFDTLRVPVSWHNHVDENFTIHPDWLARVKEVVDYALSQDLHVIVNIHHDNEEEFMFPTYDTLDNSLDYVTTIWTQVAEAFKDADEKLVFETLNEPRMVGSTYEWWYSTSAAECKEAQDCVNQFNQAAVDAIRAAGGNNAERYIMVPAYCAKSQSAITSDFVLPTDAAENKIIVSIHEYIPYNFAMSEYDASGSQDEFDEAEHGAEIDGLMDTLYAKFISKNIPVVIGEFGARNKMENTQARTNYAAYYFAAARARGITCCWWDNHCFETTAGEAFGLLNRKDNTWTYESIVDAAEKYGDGANTVFGEASSGDNTTSGATILPDGSVLFDSEIGSELILKIDKLADCGNGGGCLEFNASYKNKAYWVAYEWTYGANGVCTIDMTKPSKVTRNNNDVTDEKILTACAEQAMASTSTKIQYWWVVDEEGNNLEGASDYLKVVSIEQGEGSGSDDTDDGEYTEVAGVIDGNTITFDAPVGKEMTLDVTRDEACAGGGGCVSFNVNVDGTNYWVAYEWKSQGTGKITLDLTAPTNVNNSDEVDENGDAVKVTDEAIIAAAAAEAMKQTSAEFQYWWASDSDWEALDNPEEYLEVVGATIKVAADGGDTTEPTTPSEDPSDDPSDTPSDKPSDVAYGDVNEDGKIDVLDVITLNKNLLGGGELSAQGILNADVDNDGAPTVADALNILKYCINLVTSFPV